MVAAAHPVRERFNVVSDSPPETTRFWSAILLLASLAGNIAQGEWPADLAVEYRWSNGTVAPRYFYRSQITIRATGQSSISLDLGTASTARRSLTLDFGPDARLRDNLWNFIHSRKLDSHGGAADSVLQPSSRSAPGGGECALSVLIHGEHFGLPCAQESGGSLQTMIRAMVPPSIEAQIDAAKADFAAAAPRAPPMTLP